VVFEYALFQLTLYQTWTKKNLKISDFAFWIPARLADLPRRRTNLYENIASHKCGKIRQKFLTSKHE
jgi:hypothetical protein